MREWKTKDLVRLAFPEYRGRKIYEQIATRPVDVTSFWDGGSRDWFVMIDLRDGRIVKIPQNGTPYDGGRMMPNGVTVPSWGAIVRRSVIQGQNGGVTVFRGMPEVPAALETLNVRAIAAGY